MLASQGSDSHHRAGIFAAVEFLLCPPLAVDDLQIELDQTAPATHAERATQVGTIKQEVQLRGETTDPNRVVALLDLLDPPIRDRAEPGPMTSSF